MIAPTAVNNTPVANIKAPNAIPLTAKPAWLDPIAALVSVASSPTKQDPMQVGYTDNDHSQPGVKQSVTHFFSFDFLRYAEG